MSMTPIKNEMSQVRIMLSSLNHLETQKDLPFPPREKLMMKLVSIKMTREL